MFQSGLQMEADLSGMGWGAALAFSQDPQSSLPMALLVGKGVAYMAVADSDKKGPQGL